MIIGRDLMVQLGLVVDFKSQFFQWDGTTVHMKETSGLLGKSDADCIISQTRRSSDLVFVI